ncbi:MAG: LacI family DNA-binding transcriptional regulator [Thermoleophilia bacterium]|nr:LacI family DNA-binding transcriptional regulator [Thermoleophilia bacterium]
MRDVAGVEGVSLSTVSRVVTGSVPVKQELAQRVRDAVKLLGYRPDATASTLRRADRVSLTIGLVFEDVANAFFQAVYRSVEDIARMRGVLTIVGSSDEDPARERELTQAFLGRRVDGLVIAPAARDQSYLARDREAGVALVFVDRPPGFIDADVVMSDNAGGTSAGVAHLIARGHRRIGFLGDAESTFTARERLAGHDAALQAAGLPRDPSLVRMGVRDPRAAGDAAAAMLAAADPPTALFTARNTITVGVVYRLRELGLQHRVALVGFDDLDLADLVEPGISVVAQDPSGMGAVAATRLFARIDGAAGDHERVVLPTRLVPRGSGEIPPGGAA